MVERSFFRNQFKSTHIIFREQSAYKFHKKLHYNAL